jgi:hypothetical protein
MLQDTTPPASSRTVKVNELTPKKKRKKQAPASKHAQQDSLVPAKQVVSNPPSASSTSKQKIPTTALSPEEELQLLANSATSTSKSTPVQFTNQCAFAFDRIDEFTGTRKRGLAPRLFFTYTPEQYRKFLKTKDFIRCEGYLSQNSAGDMTLNIELSIGSAAAQKKFGNIPANSNMTIKTMRGKEFFLKSYKGAKAVVQGNVTSYEASFVLTKTDAKQLATAEIDQVRLRFTEGFQMFEVYYLDFLREQFPCFGR